MTSHDWEIAGCIVVLIGFVAAVLLFGQWLDDQGEPEEWCGREE